MSYQLIDKEIFGSGGKSIIGLSSDNNHLYVANKNNLTKILPLDTPELEPEIWETCERPNSLSLSEDNSLFILTSENGDSYSYINGKQNLIFRSILPLRDCSFIHNDKICLFAGDDLELVFIDLLNGNKKSTIKLNDSVSKLSYNKQMNLLAISLINGKLLIYSLSSAVPKLVKIIENDLPNIIGMNSSTSSIDTEAHDDECGNLDPDYFKENKVFTGVSWDVNGLKLAVPCKNHTIKIYNVHDYSLEKTLDCSIGCSSNLPIYFTNMCFDPYSGYFLVMTDSLQNCVVWNYHTGEIIFNKKFVHKLTNACWKKTDTYLSLIFGTWSGDIVIIKNIVNLQTPNPDECRALFLDSDDESNVDLPANQSDIDDINSENNICGNDSNKEDVFTSNLLSAKRPYNFEDEESIDGDSEDLNKRKSIQNSHLSILGANARKQEKSLYQPRFRYKPISQGGTPFGNSDKRYLTMNNIGYVWIVSTSTSSIPKNTITVSFFDLSRFREYHFEDLFGYDICSLSENGVLLASSKNGQIYYKPHSDFDSSWSKTIPLAKHERITGIASTPQRAVIATSYGYIRSFNQFGIVIDLEKMAPVVAIAAQEYKIFTVHYSVYHGISYSVFDKDKYYQKEQSLPIYLPLFTQNDDTFLQFDEIYSSFNPMGIKTLFFSISGDPCIFCSDNILLVLMKWRNSVENKWVPLVDTNFEIWKMSGGKKVEDLHVWPLGLNYNIMNYILIKGKNSWPEFPLPLPTEMEIRIPILAKDQILQNSDEAQNESQTNTEIIIPPYMSAEEEYLRSKILTHLLTDSLDNDGEIYGNESEILQSLAGTYDKALLRLFAASCADQNIEKALSLVTELNQDKALNAAIKIAERAELTDLIEKINNIREARLESDCNTI